VGEVVPKTVDIELPKTDETVRPDLPVIRSMQYAPFRGDRDLVKWLMRLGTREPYGFGIAHGLVQLTRPEEQKRLHPE
jgi:hypothetical protein